MHPIGTAPLDRIVPHGFSVRIEETSILIGEEQASLDKATCCV